MSIEPINDQVLIQVVEEEDSQTESGLYVPKSANMSGDVDLATVRAVGQGRPLEDGTYADLSVEEGDQVYIRKDQGVQIKHEGTEYRMVHHAQILCRLK